MKDSFLGLEPEREGGESKRVHTNQRPEENQPGPSTSTLKEEPDAETEKLESPDLGDCVLPSEERRAEILKELEDSFPNFETLIPGNLEMIKKVDNFTKKITSFLGRIERLFTSERRPLASFFQAIGLYVDMDESDRECIESLLQGPEVYLRYIGTWAPIKTRFKFEITPAGRFIVKTHPSFHILSLPGGKNQ
ncbi:unnamed protein product [Caenorhabditis auriculariae]|uniref:Uncharacterized protein n=1 Tax=Caenorhabditis auriculariae TaxID=2777116 RepID=A0A8S1H167_9PELO|nr:unnamed protein product [Caenorhabditis auriculariae]